MVRDGHIQKIKAEEVVPGDIVSVAVGDRIPADCRLLSIQSNAFGIDQAILTGESESVSKDCKAITDSQAVKQDQINMLFSGTTVVTGHATAIAVLTGGSTAIGDIHDSITSQISEPTPLKQKLNEFGDMLAKVITVICVLVWLINIQHFNDPSHGNSWAKGAIYYLKIAVSLGVAAIPEGLAVVITTCLALGTRKMAAKNAIVRSLPSVETLGSCSVICSDKTGTLTTNQMSVEKIVYLNEAGSGLDEIEVDGTTFAPEGSLTRNGKTIEDVAVSSATILQMSEVLALCNEAKLAYDSKSGTYSSIGEPTEGLFEYLLKRLVPMMHLSTIAVAVFLHQIDCIMQASTTRIACRFKLPTSSRETGKACPSWLVKARTRNCWSKGLLRRYSIDARTHFSEQMPNEYP